MTTQFSILKPDLPFALQVEITSHCNLRCKMCPLTTARTPSSLTPGHMQEVVWSDILPMARQAGQVIIAGFGEPLVNRNCIPLLQELDRNNIWISMATNGTALTPAIAGQLVALHNLFHINVSIDSPDPAVYRSIRGGDVERALNGLRNLMLCIDNPYRVTVSSVVMASNIATLSDFPPMLAALGVRRYILQGLMNYNPENGQETIVDLPDRERHIESIQKACLEAGVVLDLTLPERLDVEIRDRSRAISEYYQADLTHQDRAKNCNLPWEIPYIDKDGKVYPCCYAASQASAILGDLNQERLEAIWLGQRYQEFRRNILDGRTTPDVCRDCTAVPFGKHMLRVYAAEILFDDSILSGQAPMRLVVRNTGSRSWTPADLIRIGTSNPRGHVSAYTHPTWLGLDRITSFVEETVAPGAIATFPFVVQPSVDVLSEIFQLVVEGQCWIPNTRFTISPTANA